MSSQVGGKRISRYQLRDELGRGGMSVVWRCDDPELHRDVTLKMLLDPVLDTAEFRVRFQREASLRRALLRAPSEALRVASGSQHLYTSPRLGWVNFRW